MKTSIFVILFVLSVSNAFANRWIFQIPGDRQYPIQLINISTAPHHIETIQLFRRESGEVHQARLTFGETQADQILERYSKPAPQVQPLDSLDALGWIRFWNYVHEKSPLSIEAVRTLNGLSKVELIIHNLRLEQELD